MSSHNAMNPNGGANMRRVVEPSDPNLHLLERILSTENVRIAWERVKANKGAPGVDNVSIDEFPELFRPKWKEIRESILAGTYLPSPVKRVEIPKNSGGTRPLGIPRILDRLIQQAIYQVLMPIFDPEFSNSSFGFRPGKSAHNAINQAREYIRQGCRIAVDTDLAKFFDTVEHDVLMHRVARKVHDKRVLHLIGLFLRSGVSVNGRFQKTIRGVPQGGPLSPILGNILLDDFDKELEKRGLLFVRYADDFLIFVKSSRAGERVSQSIRRFLERKLKLTVNEKKSRVGPTDETEFLGFAFNKTRILWSGKAFQEFKRRVRKLTGRSWGVSMDFRMKKIKEYLQGWMNYFGISEFYRPIPEIDHWLRRRIRMCYWKKWKWCKTRIRNLLALGTFKKQAISTGLSRKGPWHLARTLATQSGMTNKWLAEQGLVSVKDLWAKIHYPATARLSS
ncbi:MAG: group II intron reverse transcriptase/maturase [Candidatus Ozemobacteraceae bacterium]